MMDLERFKRVRTLHDIRVEKARLRYESLVAENAMMESFKAIGNLFSLFGYIRKASAGFNTAYSVVSRISQFAGKIFRSKPRTKGAEEHEDAEDTVRF